MTNQHNDRQNQRDQLTFSVVAPVKKDPPTFGRCWESSSTSTANRNKTGTIGTVAIARFSNQGVDKEAVELVENMVVNLCNRDVRIEDDASLMTKEDECPIYNSTKVQDDVVMEEPLKYNVVEQSADDQEQQQQQQSEPEEQEPATKRQKTSAGYAASTTKRRKRCAFNETVRVVPIPLRTAYSHRVRNRIWSNSTEIQENAARNTIEFASEGWDWRAVLLDEAMHHCTTTGELIHPIHYEPHAFPLDTNAANTDDSSSTSSSINSSETTSSTTSDE